jgi:hypothetical protein
MKMRMSAEVCGWLRRATALASAVLVAACTASSGPPAARSHPAARSAAAPPADRCQLPVGNEPSSPGGKIVIGVISLGPDFVQPTVPVHQGRWRYWQKHGLWIWAGHQTVTITVPKVWQDRAAITWGVNARVVSTLRLPGALLSPGCPVGPGTWNGYAGGFYLRSSSACVPLVFAVGRRSAVVRVSVGRRCGPVP